MNEMFQKQIPEKYDKESKKRGKIIKIAYPSLKYASDRGSVRKRALVYLPWEYENSDREYKVLFLMHGGGGDEEEFFYGQDKSHTLIRLLDHMMEDGLLEPIIVVTPTFYDSKEQQKQHDLKEAGLLTKAYPEEFRNDLLPYIDLHFRVKKDRKDRAFGGFSMGAETTWEVFLNALDMVRNFIPLSGDCWIAEEKGGKSRPVETVEKMAEKIEKFAGLDYRIFAATGDLDVAYPAMSSQIREMKRKNWGTDGNYLRFVSWADGVHCYDYIYRYLFNDLPELLKNE